MASDALNAFGFSVAVFAEGNHIQLIFFGITFMMMIVFGWLTTFIAFEGKGARHSPIFNLIMYGFSGAFFLWFPFPVIFEILADVLSIIVLPIAHVFGTLFLSTFIALSFLTAIFRAKSFSSHPFACRMAGFRLRSLTKSHSVTRVTFLFSIMDALASTPNTNNNPRHTVVIII